MTFKPLDLNEFRDEVVNIAKALAKRANVPVIINGAILAEVYFSAMNSMNFHNLGDDAPDHYKEAGHLGYWLQKLKPMRYESHGEKVEMLFELLGQAGDALFGDRAKARTKLEVHKSTFDLRRSEAAEIPLNELAALMLIASLTRGAHLELIDNHHPTDERPSLTAIVDEIHKRFLWRLDRTARQIRNHSFTARGFATMVEEIFKVKGLDGNGKAE